MAVIAYIPARDRALAVNVLSRLLPPEEWRLLQDGYALDVITVRLRSRRDMEALQELLLPYSLTLTYDYDKACSIRW